MSDDRDDRVSIAAEMSDGDAESCVENGGTSSPPTPKTSPLRSSRKRRRRESESSTDSSSSSSDSSDSSSSDSSDTESDSAGRSEEDKRKQRKRRKPVRSVFSETVSSYTSYSRFNPDSSSKKNSGILSKEQLEYARKYFSTFVKDDIVETNIMNTAPIPDDAIFTVKTMDEFVVPTLSELGKQLDRGAEKGIQGIQKRLLRTMGPVSKLWQILDGIREKSRVSSRVDDVDIAAMCQYVEKIVCLLGQASLSVDRHRRIHTLLMITDDYKKAKDLLDQNEEVIAESSDKLFGDCFKKVLKKVGKTQDEASVIVSGLSVKRKRNKGKRNKYRKSKRNGSSHSRTDDVRVHNRQGSYPVPFHEGP